MMRWATLGFLMVATWPSWGAAIESTNLIVFPPQLYAYADAGLNLWSKLKFRAAQWHAREAEF